MIGISNVFNKLKNRENNELHIVIPEKQDMIFDAVNIDTNNACNQRCRFCFTDFDENKGTRRHAGGCHPVRCGAEHCHGRGIDTRVGKR